MSVAEHEAGHAACALLLGIPIDGIEMRPEQGVRGRARIEMRPETVTLNHIAAVLAGPLCSNEDGMSGCDTWPPPFPIPQTERSSDLKKLGALCRFLRVNEAAYNRTIRLTEELIATPEFQQLHRLVSTMLHVMDEIDGESLLQMHRAFGEIEEGSVA